MKYEGLYKAVMDVLQEKKALHPNQQKLDVHEPEKDELTSKDFEMLRAGKKGKMKEEEEKEEKIEEARFKKGQDVGKPGLQFKKIAAKAAAKYGSAEAGKRVAGAVLKKVLAKEENEQEEQVEETLEFHDAFTYEIKENYSFGDYLSTAKKLVGEEEAINLANKAFREQDTSLFVEEFSHSAVEDKVKAHMNAGHKVSMPKYSTRDGKPRAEYVVTDKDSGVRRRYIHQGNVVKMENMGARGKKDEK